MISTLRSVILPNICHEYPSGYPCLFVVCSRRPALKARVLIEAEDSQPFLSVASLWEMAIKISIGKLEIDQPFGDFISHQLALNGIGILSLSLEHTAAITTLPFHHRDPFDRLIAVQAKIEQMPLASADSIFDAYEIERVW